MLLEVVSYTFVYLFSVFVLLFLTFWISLIKKNWLETNKLPDEKGY